VPNLELTGARTMGFNPWGRGGECISIAFVPGSSDICSPARFAAFSMTPRTFSPLTFARGWRFSNPDRNGFLTLDLARRVGASGRVIAVDIQPKMIERLKRRAAKAGLVERIDAPIARSDSDATQWAWEQRRFRARLRDGT
jgi:hypothetical protein